MAFVPRDQGNDGALDSDAFADSGSTSVFTLSPGQVDATRDAGLEPAVIGSRVWADTNSDGRHQPGEAGIAGVIVRLLDAAGTQAAETTTGADGIYGFVGTSSGEYRVEVLAPPGLPFSHRTWAVMI